jgi:hypothetical protein
MRNLALLLSLGLLFGCADAGVVQPTEDVGSIDASADTSLPVDTAQPDTVQSDIAESDTTSEDTGAPSTCEPGEGCFGESCASPDDCLSGICTMHLGDKVCSKTCDEACPQGFSCTLVGSGGDGQYVCMSKFSHLCLPCSDAGTCSGETPNACVQYADGTRFCGGACDLENPCPSGYACQEVETADGANSYQCVNTAGVCPCSNLAIDSALATPCEATNDQGSCEGVRICEESGLSACSAGAPSAEVCNGVDDDCNGLTDENTCDDGNGCTVDTCDGAEGCKHAPLNEGECLDGDVCTIADHCEAGLCVGTPVDCNDDNPCTTDSCDGLGGCAFEHIVAICDDGDACTLGDICQDGACAGSASLTCDDGNPCTDDSCGEAGCVFEANAAGCDDGNACTSADTCAAGSCQGEQVACDDNNLCTTDSCDLKAGCVNANNAQPCDDGDGCTQGDVCADGACTSGASATCADGNPCTDDACDGKLGCVFTANVLDCDDKNSCTIGDSCVEGNCIGLGDLSCDDGNPCTEDACLADGGCTHVNVVGLCNDGDACTVNDMCVDGTCISGAPISCNDGNPCTDEVCDGGDCLFTSNVTDCDDGNACTTVSSCKNGACQGTDMLTCGDDNPCTNDVCDVESGCIFTANQAPCDDGDACTTNDTCVEESCASGAPISCDDGNTCTDEVCDGGDCLFTPNVVDCDDGNVCTTVSNCKNGACQGTDMLTCGDDNPCTDDVCDVESGCIFTANQAPCDDGDACTLGDACVDGDCEVGLDILACDDGLFCNGNETCDSQAGCVGGEPPVLDDGVSCTVDMCDEDADAVTHGADDAFCDDGSFCNGQEVCVSDMGCQPGEAPDTDDGVACTVDACDEEAGAITHTTDNSFCDDGDACNGEETCNVNLGCQNGEPIDCFFDEAVDKILLANGIFIKCFGGLTVTDSKVTCSYPLFNQNIQSANTENNIMLGLHNDAEAYASGHSYILNHIGAYIGYTGSRTVTMNEAGLGALWSCTGSPSNEHCYVNGQVLNWNQACAGGHGGGCNVMSGFTLSK